MLWFTLAKALFRSGNGDDAMIAAKQANDLDERNRQISVAVRSWKEKAIVKQRMENAPEIPFDKVLEKVERHVLKIKEKEDDAASGDAGAQVDEKVADKTVPETEIDEREKDAEKAEVDAEAEQEETAPPMPSGVTTTLPPISSQNLQQQQYP